MKLGCVRSVKCITKAERTIVLPGSNLTVLSALQKRFKADTSPTFELPFACGPIFSAPLLEFYRRRPVGILSRLFRRLWNTVCNFAKSRP